MLSLLYSLYRCIKLRNMVLLYNTVLSTLTNQTLVLSLFHIYDGVWLIVVVLVVLYGLLYCLDTHTKWDMILEWTNSNSTNSNNSTNANSNTSSTSTPTVHGSAMSVGIGLGTDTKFGTTVNRVEVEVSSHWGLGSFSSFSSWLFRLCPSRCGSIDGGYIVVTEVVIVERKESERSISTIPTAPVTIPLPISASGEDSGVTGFSGFSGVGSSSKHVQSQWNPTGSSHNPNHNHELGCDWESPNHSYHSYSNEQSSHSTTTSNSMRNGMHKGSKPVTPIIPVHNITNTNTGGKMDMGMGIDINDFYSTSRFYHLGIVNNTIPSNSSNTNRIASTSSNYNNNYTMNKVFKHHINRNNNHIIFDSRFVLLYILLPIVCILIASIVACKPLFVSHGIPLSQHPDTTISRFVTVLHIYYITLFYIYNKIYLFVCILIS